MRQMRFIFATNILIINSLLRSDPGYTGGTFNIGISYGFDANGEGFVGR